MIIERPVYFIKIKGDVKEYATNLPSTIIATYEDYIDETYIIVAANNTDFSNDVKEQYSRIHFDIKKNQKLLKKEQIEVKYLKNGIEFKIG